MGTGTDDNSLHVREAGKEGDLHLHQDCHAVESLSTEVTAYWPLEKRLLHSPNSVEESGWVCGLLTSWNHRGHFWKLPCHWTSVMESISPAWGLRGEPRAEEKDCDLRGA